MCCFVADQQRIRSPLRSPDWRGTRSPVHRRRSRSPSVHRDDKAVRSSPPGGISMLTREEFERVQQALRVTWTDPSELVKQPVEPTPAAHFPPPIPVQHPTHLVYPASVPPAGQSFPPPHHVLLTPQPMMMPAPLYEQSRPFLGPVMEPPPGLYQAPPPPLPSHEPHFMSFPVHVPVAQPMPTPIPTAAPAAFPQAPPPGVELVLPAPNPHMPSIHAGDPYMPAARLPTPATFQQMHQPGPPFVQIASESPPQVAAQMFTPTSVQFQQP